MIEFKAQNITLGEPTIVVELESLFNNTAGLCERSIASYDLKVSVDTLTTIGWELVSYVSLTSTQLFIDVDAVLGSFAVYVITTAGEEAWQPISL